MLRIRNSQHNDLKYNRLIQRLNAQKYQNSMIFYRNFFNFSNLFLFILKQKNDEFKFIVVDNFVVRLLKRCFFR